MTLLLKQLFAFIKLLNSDTGTYQIASGIALGTVLGFTPFFALQTLLVFFLAFFFRVQFGAVLITAFFLKFPAYLLDPVFHQIGQYVLEMESLKSVFVAMSEAPIVPFTRFNNTIVMGSGVASILCLPFVFGLSVKLVKTYRAKVLERFQGTKFWKLIKATGFYKWYVKYEEMKG